MKRNTLNLKQLGVPNAVYTVPRLRLDHAGAHASRQLMAYEALARSQEDRTKRPAAHFRAVKAEYEAHKDSHRGGASTKKKARVAATEDDDGDDEEDNEEEEEVAPSKTARRSKGGQRPPKLTREADRVPPPLAPPPRPVSVVSTDTPTLPEEVISSITEKLKAYEDGPMKGYQGSRLFREAMIAHGFTTGLPDPVPYPGPGPEPAEPIVDLNVDMEPIDNFLADHGNEQSAESYLAVGDVPNFDDLDDVFAFSARQDFPPGAPIPLNEAAAVHELHNELQDMSKNGAMFAPVQRAVAPMVEGPASPPDSSLAALADAATSAVVRRLEVFRVSDRVIQRRFRNTVCLFERRLFTPSVAEILCPAAVVATAATPVASAAAASAVEFDVEVDVSEFESYESSSSSESAHSSVISPVKFPTFVPSAATSALAVDTPAPVWPSLLKRNPNGSVTLKAPVRQTVVVEEAVEEEEDSSDDDLQPITAVNPKKLLIKIIKRSHPVIAVDETPIAPARQYIDLVADSPPIPRKAAVMSQKKAKKADDLDIVRETDDDAADDDGFVSAVPETTPAAAATNTKKATWAVPKIPFPQRKTPAAAVNKASVPKKRSDMRTVTVTAPVREVVVVDPEVASPPVQKKARKPRRTERENLRTWYFDGSYEPFNYAIPSQWTNRTESHGIDRMGRWCKRVGEK